MGFFDSLKQPFAKRKLRQDQREELKRILWEVVEDGQISNDELTKINSFFNNSELSFDEFVIIKQEVFIEIVNSLTADRRITTLEGQTLTHIAERLDLSTELREWMRKEISYYSLLHTIETSESLPSIRVENIILKKDEIAHYQ